MSGGKYFGYKCECGTAHLVEKRIAEGLIEEILMEKGLIPKPKKRVKKTVTVWGNLYDEAVGLRRVYKTRQEANNAASGFAGWTIELTGEYEIEE